MALINTQTLTDGNRCNFAAANIETQLDGGDGYFYCGLGTQLQVNVELFDEDGVSLGIQGLNYTVAGTEFGYNPEVGGIRPYDLVREFCKVIGSSWDPAVRCVPGDSSRQVATFRVKPAEGQYGVARIRDWVYVNAPLAPAA